MLKKIRRVMTGHNEEGKSIVLYDGWASSVESPSSEPNVGMTDLWETTKTPPTNLGNEDAAARPVKLPPPPNGTIFRIVELPPDSDRNYSHLKSLGEEGKAMEAGERHPGFHRTSSVDYIVMLEGELYCMLQEGEILLKPGDCLIQRGTSHAWSNRSNKRAIIAAIMMDAEPL